MRCACQSCDCLYRFSNASCHVGWLAFLFGMLKILPGWHGLVLAGWICLLVGRMFFLGILWPVSFLVISIVWNQRPKRKCWVMLRLELADLGFNILEVVGHHLHHLHHLCHLQALDCVSAAWTRPTLGRRQRAPSSGNDIDRIRRMRQNYVQSAWCHGSKQSRTSLQTFCCRLRAASSGAAAFQSCNGCSL